MHSHDIVIVRCSLNAQNAHKTTVSQSTYAASYSCCGDRFIMTHVCRVQYRIAMSRHLIRHSRLPINCFSQSAPLSILVGPVPSRYRNPCMASLTTVAVTALRLSSASMVPLPSPSAKVSVSRYRLSGAKMSIRGKNQSTCQS